MASSIGSTIASFGAPFMPDLSESANIQTALKLLYYGTGGTLNNSNGIHGALYTLYTGNPTLAGNPTISGSTILTKTDAVTLASTAHAFQVGASASTNLAVSPTIIQARNNGAASTLNINSLGGNITLGNASSTVTIVGDLTVSGNTTTLDVATLLVEDKEIVIGNVATPSNTTANGGGIRLEASTDGLSDKTITWDSTNANWTTSENWNLASGKALRINGGSAANVISGTATALVVGENATTSTTVGNTTGTVVLNSGTVLGTQTTQNLFNTVATTLNIGGAANVAVNIGANGGTASILNPTVTLTNATTLNINGATQSIVGGTVAGTASIFNTNTGSVNLGGSATTLTLGASGTGTTSIRSGTVSLSSASTINLGAASSTVNFGTGPTLASASGTATLFNTGVTAVNAFGNATTIGIGNASGTTTIAGNLTMSTTGKQLLLANGNSTTAPLKFSGTGVVSFPNWSAGDIDYDGKVFRGTPGTAGFGIIDTSYIYMLDSDLSLSTSTTTAFGNYIVLPVGYYQFEIMIPFQFTYAVSATALSLGIKGTATTTGVYLLQEHFSNTGALTNQSFAANVDPSGLVTAGRTIVQWRQQTAVQSLNTSNLISQIDSLGSGSRYGIYRIRGWMNVTTAGSFYPAATFTGGGSGSIKAGGFARVTPISSGSGFWQTQI